MIDYINKKWIKYLLFALMAFSLLTKTLSTDFGLPYLHHWDEPLVTVSSIEMMKTGDFKPKRHAYAYGGVILYTALALDVLNYYRIIGKEIKNGGVGHIEYVDTGIDESWPGTAKFPTLSHPSFIKLHRIFVSILGTLCLLIIFLIVELLFSKYTALYCVIILASSINFFLNSRFITTDVPLAFFVITTVYFLIKYNISKEFSWLIWAAIFSGLSIGTKYSGFPIIIVLYLATIINFRNSKLRYKSFKFIFIMILPFVVFVIFNPYAIFDMRGFLQWTGWIINVYKVQGGHGIEKFGLDHILHQFNEILKDFSFVILPLLFFSFVKFFRDKKVNKTLLTNGLILILFPIIYFLFMSSNKVIYHRNYMVIYPFISILSGIGIVGILDFFLKFIKKDNIKNVIGNTFPFLVILVFLPSFSLVIDKSNDSINNRDTRTKLVNHIIETPKLLSGNKSLLRVAVSEELRLHKNDYDSLPFQISNFKHYDLIKAIDSFDYVIIGSPMHKSKFLYNDLKNEIESRVIYEIEGSPILIDRYAPLLNPNVKILRGDALKNIGQEILPAFTPINTKHSYNKKNHVFPLVFNDTLKCNNVNILKGKFNLKISGNSTLLDSVGAHIKLFLNENLYDDFYFSDEKIKKDYIINLKEDLNTITIVYDNDLYDSKKFIDRNAFFYSLTVRQLTQD